jgi:L-lactate dehydrogenase
MLSTNSIKIIKQIGRGHRRAVRTYASTKTTSIGIVGAGGVGSAIASSLIHKNVVNSIKIADANQLLCEGVVLDLQDEGFISGTVVEHSSIQQLKTCDIVIITAGAKQKPDEPRTDLIKRNAQILHSILYSLFPINPNTVIIIVSNPVDILTTLAQKWCADYIPTNQVIGSGTFLDSQRLRVALAKRLKISVKSIHAYVIGEHGDSQVIARSSASIGGCQLDDMYNFVDQEYTELEDEVRNKAYEIIKRKGATFHGIGACVATIAEAIVLNKNEIIPVSVYHTDFDAYLGWPSIIGSNGVVDIIPLHLSAKELNKVSRSAGIIKKCANDILQSPPTTL